MSEETTTDAGGDDFDPSDLSEEVAEEAQREEKKPAPQHTQPQDDDDDDTERRREKRAEAKAAPKREEKRETKAEDEAAAPKKEAKPKEAPRVYKAKVRGKETDVPAEHVEALAALFDMDPQDLLRGPQVFKAGQEKLRSAAEKEKQAEIIKKTLSTDTRKALKEAGLTDEAIYNFAISTVNELMETERLQKENPAEMERRKIQAELDAVKAEKAKIAEEREEEEQAKYQAKAEEKLGQEIRSVLDSGKLPKDPYVVKRLASHMLDHLEKGGDAEDLSASDFVPLVLEEMHAEHATFIGKLSGEDIIARFPETAEKVRKAYAARVGRRAPPERQPDAEREERPERTGPKVRRTTSDVLAAFKAGRL
jgi:hypothetical protein